MLSILLAKGPVSTGEWMAKIAACCFLRISMSYAEVFGARVKRFRGTTAKEDASRFGL